MLLSHPASLEIEDRITNVALVPDTNTKRGLLGNSFFIGGLPGVHFGVANTYLVFPRVR